MDEKYVDIVFTTEEIADYLFKELVKLGYAPEEDELDDLAEIIFEFILEKVGAEEVDEGE
jgi:hypothetical protein